MEAETQDKDARNMLMWSFPLADVGGADPGEVHAQNEIHFSASFGRPFGIVFHPPAAARNPNRAAAMPSCRQRICAANAPVSSRLPCTPHA